jgi:teichuronic acid biosynthesis glycosyltransferase TuaH
MNIAVVPTTDWIGHPIPTRLHHIFERMAERHDIHVIRFALYESTKLETNLKIHNLRDIRVGNLAQYYLINTLNHTSSIQRIMRENNLDVAIISNILIGYTAARVLNNKVKTVFDLSDHFPSSAAGYFFDMRSTIGKVATFSIEKLVWLTLRTVNSTVTCSKTLTDYADCLGAKNIQMIPNGVDESFFEKNNPGEIKSKYGLNQSIVIGYVGTIEFWLDIFPLLEAMKILSNKHYDVKLVILGSKAKSSFVNQVEKRINELNISHNIIWLDFVPYLEVPKYISAMDLCVIPFNVAHPTAYYSAPIKLLEYFALEKPVLSTSIPNVTDIASSYIDIVFKSLDYVRAIESFIKCPEPYLLKAKKGKEIAKQFTWDKLSKEYELFLNRLVNS